MLPCYFRKDKEELIHLHLLFMETINTGAKEVWMQINETSEAKQIYKRDIRNKSTMFLKEGMHWQAQ